MLAQAGLLAYVLHAAIVESRPLAGLILPLILLPAAIAVRAIATALRGVIAARASRLVRTELRVELYRKLAAAGPQSGQDSGHLLSRLVEQIETLDPYFARYRPQATAAVVIPVMILIAVFAIDWLAGLLLALAAPLIPVFMILVGWGAEAASLRQQQALGRLSGLFHDRLRALVEIRRLGAESGELNRLRSLAEEFRERTMRVLRLAFLSSAVLEFFAAVAIASLAIYIGLGLLGFIGFGPAGSLTLGTGLFILLLAPEFFNPMRQLAQHWHDRADALAAADDLSELHRLPAARPGPKKASARIQDTACPVTVRDLHHAWPDRPPVLQGINLQVRAGEKLLITGPSGGGKSTLISAMAGFFSAQCGEIRYGDSNINDLDQHGLALTRSWLGQRPVLFAGTLYTNIAMGRANSTSERVREVAELAGVTEFSDYLPNGLNSEIGEQGLGLSGGQAQRVALARALLANRPVLFLDEPTASLDEVSEKLIWQAISRACEQRGMTVICASHSPMAQAWADRELHLDHGQLREVVR